MTELVVGRAVPLRVVHDADRVRKERVLDRLRFLSVAAHKKDGEQLHAAAVTIVDGLEAKERAGNLALALLQLYTLGSLQETQRAAIADTLRTNGFGRLLEEA